MSPHQARQGSEARAKAKAGLYWQGAVSLLLGLALLALNLAYYRGRWWFWWPLLGLAILWGIRAVHVCNHRRWETLEQRQLKEDQDRQERTRQIVDD